MPAERPDLICVQASMEQHFADCKVQFPEGSKNYVDKNKCNAAAATPMLPFTSYPDPSRVC